MSELLKKAAYLKGYVEGTGTDLQSDEGKIIKKLVDIIEEMAEEIEYLSADVYENRELIDEMDGTLLTVVQDVYGDDDDEEDDDDDFFDVFDEDDDFDDFEDDDEDEEYSSDFFEIQCPECGEDFMICYDDILSNGEIRCTHCNQKVELDVDFEDDEDDEWSI